MRRVEDQIKKLAAFTSVMVIAAAEAMAQDKQQGPRRIVVSLADRKLAVVEDDKVVKIFEVAVGAHVSPSPVGTFKIANCIADPTWYGKGKIVPPGKGNPIGTRWLGLSRKGYGIHGTNVPSSIGHAASHGCIRMRNREVEELFKMVQVGDQVELYAERNPELDRIFESTALVAAAAAAAAPVSGPNEQ